VQNRRRRLAPDTSKGVVRDASNRSAKRKKAAALSRLLLRTALRPFSLCIVLLLQAFGLRSAYRVFLAPRHAHQNTLNARHIGCCPEPP
jgi:hypothetical protein